MNNQLTDGSIQSDIENALFGGPIPRTAPELMGLSDSSQMGGIDYSFYTSPGSRQSPIGYTDLSSGDPFQDFYGQNPGIDPSSFDAGDSGGYVNPDGSISY